jgi:hypothetical protein
MKTLSRSAGVAAAVATSLAATIAVGGLIWNASSIGSGTNENRRRIDQLEASLTAQRLEIRDDLRNSEARLSAELKDIGDKVDALLIRSLRE